MIQHLLSKTNKSSIFQRRSLAASTLIDAYRPRLHKASWCALTFPSTRCSHDPCRVLAELFVILRETLISLLVSGSVVTKCGSAYACAARFDLSSSRAAVAAAAWQRLQSALCLKQATTSATSFVLTAIFGMNRQPFVIVVRWCAIQPYKSHWHHITLC
jgi:hypothetical protein